MVKPRLVEIGRRPDVAVAIMDADAVEPDRRDHAVAVEPMGKPVPVQVVAARAVAEERAAQGARDRAFDLVDGVVVLGGKAFEALAPPMSGAVRGK